MDNLTYMIDEEIAALRKQTVNLISSLNNKQMAKKIQLNSAYGALG